MRISIIGIGALGCLLGAKLGAVADVSLIGRWPEQIAAIQQDGLWLEHPNGELSNHRLNVTTESRPISASDIVLVAVKSRQTGTAAELIVQQLGPRSLVISLQNGLNNRERLAHTLGSNRVTLGVTSEGATVQAAGKVRHAGHGQTHLGRDIKLDHTQLVHLEEIADLFNLAGLETTIVDNTAGLLWGKLAVNAAINPLTALLKVPNGYLLKHPGLVDLMSRAAMEVAAVALASGIVLPFADAAEQAIAVAQATATNHSSMLQDISRGVPTEIDAICGAVAALGRDVGVPTPLNACLYTLVKRVENGELVSFQPGDETGLLSILKDCELVK